MQDLNQLSLQAYPPQIDNPPRFKQGDIAFIISDTRYDVSENWPAMGSKYEIDIKIMDYYSTGPNPISCDIRNNWYYNAITGKGHNISDIHEDLLLKAKDKGLLFENLTLTQDTEFAPIGTRFTKDSDYWKNESLGVYLSKEIISKLKKKKIL
jgi:hypothetical protein